MAQRDVILDPEGDILIILHAADFDFDKLGRTRLRIWASDSTECDSATERRFRVSSKHLSLACTYFKNIMEGSWRETVEIQDDGLRHCVMKGFQASATSIVLSVIHGKYRHVPRSIKLEGLAEIAIVVDFLGCHEAMGFIAEGWIRDLQYNMCVPPRQYDWTALVWIVIAGVFRKSEIFTACTRQAIVDSQNPINAFGLPILSQVVDVMNRDRNTKLDKIILAFDAMMRRLYRRARHCPGCEPRLVEGVTMYYRSAPDYPLHSPQEGRSITSTAAVIYVISKGLVPLSNKVNEGYESMRWAMRQARDSPQNMMNRSYETVRRAQGLSIDILDRSEGFKMPSQSITL
ncbi:hypothetical protein GGS21DRAFT_392990 [Xylaria nigripes]|nr:hypothetical protein GGS21DRAFT_392990 [Xylaria nigripes]